MERNVAWAAPAEVKVTCIILASEPWEGGFKLVVALAGALTALRSELIRSCLCGSFQVSSKGPTSMVRAMSFFWRDSTWAIKTPIELSCCLITWRVCICATLRWPSAADEAVSTPLSTGDRFSSSPAPVACCGDLMAEPRSPTFGCGGAVIQRGPDSLSSDTDRILRAAPPPLHQAMCADERGGTRSPLAGNGSHRGGPEGQGQDTHICVYIYIYIHMRICVCKHTYVHTYLYIYTDIHA